jgi:hypothetical protein
MDRDPPPSLDPRPLEGGDGWYVHIKWSDGRNEQVGAFHSEDEARDWITHKSDAWLKDYERRSRTSPEE